MDINKAKAYCRALPGATEDIKWENNLVFSVGEKMFAVMGADGHQRGISLKVDDDRFLELTDRPGIIPAPYLARAKWVRIEDAKAVSDAEAAGLLQRSYELVFAKLTRKLQRQLQGSST
ncbi:MmcQ/YjbR family DNA-binding protein [Duganella sp. P38]|uniref:MmcQ/YjbR family DNA-binding protein n=1 Tax=Duganella sp. P38 TaxID=3423949 RepID=UPI003D790E6E